MLHIFPLLILNFPLFLKISNIPESVSIVTKCNPSSRDSFSCFLAVSEVLSLETCEESGLTLKRQDEPFSKQIQQVPDM